MVHLTDDDYMYEEVPSTEKCFYCNKDISAPFISWQGHVMIKIHRGCAELLAQRLLFDALTLEHESRKSHVRIRH